MVHKNKKMKHFCKQCKLMVEAVRSSTKIGDSDYRIEFKCPQCDKILMSYRTAQDDD